MKVYYKALQTCSVVLLQHPRFSHVVVSDVTLDPARMD